MTLTVSATQLDRASKPDVRVATLVRLETYSDWTAQTVDETYYWSNLPLLYSWDGVTNVYWDRVLVTVTPIARGFNHIPETLNLDLREGVTLGIDTTEKGGDYLWTLLDGTNLIGAKIEIASLLLPDWDGARWWDLSSEASDHVVRFRGEVAQVPAFRDEDASFQLVCNATEPVLKWPRALDVDEVDPRDLGKRYPVPVGNVKRLPLINREVGATTTMVSSITSTYTGAIEVSSLDGFPTSGAFFVTIGEEMVQVTNTGTTELTISNRGVLTTTAAAHGTGTTVVEIAGDTRFVVSGYEMQAITALYLKATGSAIYRVPKGDYNFNPGNQQLDSGADLAVVSMNRDQLIKVLSEAGSEVSQQPDVSVSGSADEYAIFSLTSFADGQTSLNAVNCSCAAVTSGVAVNGLRWNYNGTVNQAGAIYVDSGAIPDESRTVERFRLTFDVRLESNSTDTTSLRYDLSDFLNVNAQNQILRELAAGPSEIREVVTTAWRTCPANTTLADLVNTSGAGSSPRIIAYLNQSGGGTGSLTEAFIYVRESYVQVELTPEAATVSQDVTEISGAAKSGNGLQFLADVSGVLDVGTPTDSGIDFTTTTGFTAVSSTISVVGNRIEVNTPTAVQAGVQRGWVVDLSGDGTRVYFDFLTNFANKQLFDATDGYAISLILSSSGGATEYGFGPSCPISDTATTLCVDLDAPYLSRTFSGAGVDLANVIAVQFRARWETTGGSTYYFRVDNLRTAVATRPIRVNSVAAWIGEYLAGDADLIDSTTFSTAQANLGNVAVGGDLRLAGETMADVMATLGWETRTNIVNAEGSSASIYKAFNSANDFDFGSSTQTLENFRQLTTETKQIDEQPTQFEALFDLDQSLVGVGIGAYRGLLRANETDNDLSTATPTAIPTIDITNAQARVGIRAANPQVFQFLATANEIPRVWGYYVSEALRGGSRRFTCTVGYAEGYALEPGDIVSIQPRWAAAAIKVRVLGVEIDLTQPEIRLRLEEVT